MTHNRKLWLLVAILTALWLFLFVVKPLMAQPGYYNDNFPSGFAPSGPHTWMGPETFRERQLPRYCFNCGFPQGNLRYRFPYEQFTPRGRPFIPYYPGSPFTPRYYPRYPG